MLLGFSAVIAKEVERIFFQDDIGRKKDKNIIARLFLVVNELHVCVH